MKNLMLIAAVFVLVSLFSADSVFGQTQAQIDFLNNLTEGLFTMEFRSNSRLSSVRQALYDIEGQSYGDRSDEAAATNLLYRRWLNEVYYPITRSKTYKSRFNRWAASNLRPNDNSGSGGFTGYTKHGVPCDLKTKFEKSKEETQRDKRFFSNSEAKKFRTKISEKVFGGSSIPRV